MNDWNLLGAVAGLMCVVGLAAPAAAQDVPAAEALFKQGVRDMLAGRYEKGCPAIAESHRLDPHAGTLFTVAECEAKRGRIATAVARYEDYLALFARMDAAQQSKQKGREKIAADRRAALAPEVPSLTLTLAPDAPPGTVVTRDGSTLSGVGLGVRLPIDPGEHVLTATAPGGPPTEVRITLALRSHKQVLLEVKAAPTPPETGATAPSEVSSGRRAGGYVAGSLGVLGIVLGGIMGALTLAERSTILQRCHGAACDHEGKLAADKAKAFGLASSVGFGVGAAGVGAGALLLFLKPQGPRSPSALRAPRQAAPWVRVGALSAGPAGALFGIRGAL